MLAGDDEEGAERDRKQRGDEYALLIAAPPKDVSGGKKQQRCVDCTDHGLLACAADHDRQSLRSVVNDRQSGSRRAELPHIASRMGP
jgi:hypothetical protein